MRIEQILDEAIKKQIQLLSKDSWKDELYDFAPPILWFGNLNSNKPKIVTIGANPSEHEVIDKSQNQINRFKLLAKSESLSSVMTNKKLVKIIIEGYNNYFQHMPYSKWFGKEEDPYNVECFLRGMNASYYDNQTCKYTAIHIDLFPFPTKSDYNKIKDEVSKDIFAKDWAKKIVSDLLLEISPHMIVIFGRGNSTVFFKNIFPQTDKILFKKHKSSKYSTHEIIVRNSKYKIACLSTNLGNPKPFKKNELKEYGEFIYKECTAHNKE